MHVFDLSITYHQKIMTCPDTMLAATYYPLNVALTINYVLWSTKYRIIWHQNIFPTCFICTNLFVKISDQKMTIQLLILDITLKKLPYFS